MFFQYSLQLGPAPFLVCERVRGREGERERGRVRGREGEREGG